MLTILLLAHNERQFVEAAVESIRNFRGNQEVSVILIDNASEDNLQPWAMSQEDISYVYMDKGIEPWGSCINQVLEAFSVQGEILIMQSHYMLTAGCIQNMIEAFHSLKNIGAAGCVNNNCAVSLHQRPERKVQNYIDGNRYALEHVEDKMRIVPGLESGILLTNKEIVEKTGGFDPELYTVNILIKDFCLRLLDRNLRTVVCRNAFMYDMDENNMESPRMLSFLSHDIEVIEKKQKMHYFNMNGNMALLTMIDKTAEESFSVLEVGCDCGATLNDIKIFFPRAVVYGCDINANAVRVASCFADQAFVTNIEEETLEIEIEKNSIDYIIFGDVLEHLHNPGRTIEYAAEFLKEGGCILANIPNVMHISVMRQLLHGDFTYTDTGLLDRTHIHLFTYKEIIRMFMAAGYVVEIMEPSFITGGDDPLIERLLELDPAAERFMYEAFQYKVRARKKLKNSG